jgi:hypothetical protein
MAKWQNGRMAEGRKGQRGLGFKVRGLGLGFGSQGSGLGVKFGVRGFRISGVQNFGVQGLGVKV